MTKKLRKQKGFTPTPKSLVSGFTILEAIVAIAILSVSISGVFAAVKQSLSQISITKDEVRAYYLAQEAIEIIRNKRDDNQLTKINFGTGTWLDGITDAANCPFNKVCRVDAKPFPPSVTYCGVAWGSCPVLKQDTGTFLYNYSVVSGTNVATTFKREIMLEQINANEISITVSVSWAKGSFKAKTILFNWI
jgi:type II secretory pathway pseudopilin PulG